VDALQKQSKLMYGTKLLVVACLICRVTTAQHLSLMTTILLSDHESTN